MEGHPDRSRAAVVAAGARYAAVLAVVVACVAVTHGPEIEGNFHQQYYETRLFIQYNEANVGSFIDCFTTLPYYPGLYRPVSTTCFYYLAVKAFGARTEPFKVVNVVFLVANAVLLFMVARLLIPFPGAFLAAALFASRGAHVNVVLFSVEMQTLLAVFFGLLTLYLYIRARREGRDLLHNLAYVCFVLAVLSKESAVVTVVAVFLYEWLFEEKRDFRAAATYAAITVVWAAFVFGVIRRVDSRRLIAFDYAFGPGDVLRNYLLYGLDFSNLLLPPSQGAVQPFGSTIEGLADSAATRGVLAVLMAGWVGLVALGRRIPETARVAVFGFALFVFHAAPYAVLGERVIIRYSYAGHAGIALALGAAVAALQLRRTHSATRSVASRTPPQ